MSHRMRTSPIVERGLLRPCVAVVAALIGVALLAVSAPGPPLGVQAGETVAAQATAMQVPPGEDTDDTSPEVGPALATPVEPTRDGSSVAAVESPIPEPLASAPAESGPPAASFVASPQVSFRRVSAADLSPPSLAFAPTGRSERATPGDTVDFTHTITNAGSVELSVAFRVDFYVNSAGASFVGIADATDPANVTDISDRAFAIAPGQGAAIRVTLRIPDDAIAGTTTSFTVTAVPDSGDPVSASDSVTVGAMLTLTLESADTVAFGSVSPGGATSSTGIAGRADQAGATYTVMYAITLTVDRRGGGGWSGGTCRVTATEGGLDAAALAWQREDPAGGSGWVTFTSDGGDGCVPKASAGPKRYTYDYRLRVDNGSPVGPFKMTITYAVEG